MLVVSRVVRSRTSRHGIRLCRVFFNQVGSRSVTEELNSNWERYESLIVDHPRGAIEAA